MNIVEIQLIVVWVVLFYPIYRLLVFFNNGKHSIDTWLISIIWPISLAFFIIACLFILPMFLIQTAFKCLHGEEE